jgi:hypothetical protein
MSHLWLDFRGIHDNFNKKAGINYFENSRRATYIHRQYGIENPLRFSHYNEFVWGLTASDEPGPAVLEVNGVQRQFFGYEARGAPLVQMTVLFPLGGSDPLFRSHLRSLLRRFVTSPNVLRPWGAARMAWWPVTIRPIPRPTGICEPGCLHGYLD